jgi:hypothetical protein
LYDTDEADDLKGGDEEAEDGEDVVGEGGNGSADAVWRIQVVSTFRLIDFCSEVARVKERNDRNAHGR